MHFPSLGLVQCMDSIKTKGMKNEFLCKFLRYPRIEFSKIYSNLKPKGWKKRDLVYIMSRGQPPGHFTVHFNPICVGEPRIPGKIPHLPSWG